MRLYHGSNIAIDNINLAMCRPYKDFGQGFYLTDIEEQAEKMAIRVARIYGKKPIVNVYEIDDAFKETENLKIKDFETLSRGMIYKKTSSQYSFHTENSVKLLRKVMSKDV